MQALAFDTKQFSIPEGIPAHIDLSIARGLPELQPAICAHDGTMVIVGSGPSVAGFVDEIKAEREKGRPIWAIKGAHDWLISQGIEPDIFLSIEPRDRRNNVSRETENTIYLLASRVCPEVFDHLKGRNVMVWHCASTEDENEVLKKHRRYGIGGMSTSGLRAVHVGVHQGYRNFVMYGMDSCNAPDGITKRIDGSLTGQQQDVIVDGRRFICNVAMAKQAYDFQFLYSLLPGIHIDIKGDGLLAAINRLRKKEGKPT